MAPHGILFKAEDLLKLNLRSRVEACEATCVDTVVVVGRVREGLDPLGVVGPADEALGSEPVRADVDETSKSAEDQCSHKVPQDLPPGSLPPQFLDRQLSPQTSAVDSLVDCVP